MVAASRKSTFALVGCGRVARQHVRALFHHAGRAELVAVCDPCAERVQALGQETAHLPTPARGFDSLEAMLRELRPDAVILATPSGLHAAQAMLAARHGCHVVCEKPIATHLEDARAMVDACRDARRQLFAVMQLRYSPTLQWLHRAVADGRLGQIYMVEMSIFWTRPQSYYDADAWRGTRAMDGGALLNQTSHYVDLLRWIFGPVAQVQAITATLGRAIEVEDSGVLNLRWQSGALGSMSVTMLTHPHNLRAALTVAGSRGTVVLGGIACDEIQVARFDESDGQAAQTRAEIEHINQETRAFYGDGHIRYYQNVLDVLQGGARSDIDGLEGLKTLEIIEAAYISAQTGAAVELP